MNYKLTTCYGISLLFFMCLGGLIGCAQHAGVNGVDCLADVPKGAVPEPVGTKLCQWQNAQIQQAAGDQTTLYRADFIGDSVELSPGAVEKIVRAIRSGTAYAQNWIIEPSNDNYLDSARVNTLVQQLAICGVTNPQVGLGIPTAFGLPAVFAEAAIGNLTTGSQGRASIPSRFNGGFNRGFNGGFNRRF